MKHHLKITVIVKQQIYNYVVKCEAHP